MPLLWSAPPLVLYPLCHEWRSSTTVLCPPPTICACSCGLQKAGSRPKVGCRHFLVVDIRADSYLWPLHLSSPCHHPASCCPIFTPHLYAPRCYASSLPCLPVTASSYSSSPLCASHHLPCFPFLPLLTSYIHPECPFVMLSLSYL